MKKTMLILLALVMMLVLCACGAKNSKYVGTYTSEGSMYLPTTKPYNGGTLYTDDFFDGEYTLVINTDGTGIERFVAENYNGRINYVVYECSVEWEVIDEYLYVTGECINMAKNESKNIDDRYRLEGKTLVDADSGFSFKKQNID